MNRSRDLVDKEAASFEILEAKVMRERLVAALDQSEAQKREWQLRDSLAWLDLQGHDREQDDLLERCATSRQQGTCEWFLRHPKVVAWLDEEDQRATLWLKGKPGAGKTTLAVYLLQVAPISPQASIFYCLCPDRLTRPSGSVCGLIFRSLIAQLIRVNSEVLPYVYEIFVKLGATPSLPKVRDLLGTLLQSPGTTYIILDGLDECESADQRHVLGELQNLLRPDARTKDEKLKVLICSRETKEISRRLSQVRQIFLSDEQQEMSKDICKFTKSSLAELSDRFPTEIINDVSGEVVKKADGMFLWVRLVLSMLLDQESIMDLQEAVHRLPIGLESAYRSILTRIQAQMDESQRIKVKAILSWLAFACRPLRSFELCDALVFSENRVLDEQTKLGKGVLDICKPLIEEREGHVFALVHFSAREYLLSQKSGPFLASLQVQSDITHTCLRYLATCRIFLVDPASTIAQQQIVKEFHSLFPYAHEYWLRHMLALIELSQTPQNSPAITSTTQSAVDVLSQFARYQVPAQISVRNTLGELSAVENVELACLSKEMFLNLPPTLRQYLQFRERVASLPGNQGASKHTSDQDPTLLSQSYRCYRAAFEHLLSDSAIQDCASIGMESKDLKHFQDIHRASGYLCSFPGCKRGFLGFPSASDCNNHESFHSPQFRCIELNCDFSKIGFSSRQALRKHKLKYHTSVDEVPLPRFGHRQAISEPAEVKDFSGKGKTPKTATFKLTTPKAPGTKEKKTPAKTAVSDEDMADEDVKEPEKPFDPLQDRKYREKEVLFLRHKLQKGFLPRNQAPRESKMAAMSNYLKKLEGYSDLEADIIRTTKINKVLKYLIKLNTIPKDEEFNFRGRSVELLSKWKELLGTDGIAEKNGAGPSSAVKKEDKPTTNGTHKDGGALAEGTEVAKLLRDGHHVRNPEPVPLLSPRLFAEASPESMPGNVSDFAE